MSLRMLAIRLHRGHDLKQAVAAYVSEQKVSAGTILSGVGGLSAASIRMAGATPDNQHVRTYHEPLEIVSLAGASGQRKG
jgi:uncharacterized protein